MGWPSSSTSLPLTVYVLINFSQYRIYRLADVDFGKEISRAERVMYYSESRAIDDDSRRGMVSVSEELWEATVKGKTVAVKTYKGPIQVLYFLTKCNSQVYISEFCCWA